MKYLIPISLFFALLSCSKQKPFILISKDSGNRIHTWLQKVDTAVETLKFYYFPKDSLQ
jgi:hypothetical protein